MKKILMLIGFLLLATPVWGQWGDVGSFVNNNTKTAGVITFTVNATLNSGNAGICVMATDNQNTASGDNDEHTSLTDSDGNLWTQQVEMTNAANANASCTVSVWTAVAGADLAAPDTITFGFSPSNPSAKAVRCWEFTIGSGNVITQEGTAQTTEADNTDIPTDDSDTVTSAAYNFFRGACYEGDIDTTGLTPTTNFTSLGVESTDGGGESGNMGVTGEFRLTTSTVQTSDPALTGDATVDNAEGFVVLKEAAPPTTTTQAIIVGD